MVWGATYLLTEQDSKAPSEEPAGGLRCAGRAARSGITGLGEITALASRKPCGPTDPKPCGGEC